MQPGSASISASWLEPRKNGMHAVVANVEEADFGAGGAQPRRHGALGRQVVAGHRREIDQGDFLERQMPFLS